MTEKETTAPISREELIRRIQDAATPIDFDAMIALGLMEKKGAWYKVHDLSALSQHVADKIIDVKSGKLVKFSGVTATAKRLANKYPK